MWVFGVLTGVAQALSGEPSLILNSIAFWAGAVVSIVTDFETLKRAYSGGRVVIGNREDCGVRKDRPGEGNGHGMPCPYATVR